MVQEMNIVIIQFQIGNYGQEGLSALQLADNQAGEYLTILRPVFFLHPQMSY